MAGKSATFWRKIHRNFHDIFPHGSSWKTNPNRQVISRGNHPLGTESDWQTMKRRILDGKQPPIQIPLRTMIFP